jgi:hypothetical protein
MEDFSDATNRTIILFLFIVFILYLKYLETQLKIKKNMKDVKCNPIQMIVGGIIDSENSTSSFQQCMRISAQDALADYSSEQLSSQRNALQQNISELNQKISQNEKLNEKEKERLRDEIKASSANINLIASRQNEINNQLNANVSSISTITTLAKDTISQLSNVLDTFKQSSLVTNLQ